MQETIMVLFGGKSVEHDISILTALQAIKSLPSKYQALPVYIDEKGQWLIGENFDKVQTFINFKNAKVSEVTLKLGAPYLLINKRGKFKNQIKIDCALLCLHGKNGEDGSVQGLLRLCDIPFTSCTQVSSGVCMDKALTKKILNYHHLLTPKFVDFYAHDFNSSKFKILQQVEKELTFPVIVKPARLGSSVGISICADIDSLTSKIENALLYDNKILIEEFIDRAREYACAVIKLSDREICSNVQEMNKGEIYTFDDKYIDKKQQNSSKIPASFENKIKKLAAKTYKALECDGVARVDFLSDGHGKIYVGEINTIPGSLAFNLFNEPFKDILECLISEAKKKMADEDNDCYQFNSRALEIYSQYEESSKYTK